MSLDLAARLFQFFLAISLIIQTAEFLILARRPDVRDMWSWTVQGDDLPNSNKVFRRIFDFIYRDDIHYFHLIGRLIVAASLFWGANLFSGLFLFFGTMAILIRWRGAFNGGSDFMTVVAVTGLVIAMVASEFVGHDQAWNAALWYVAIHSITSYFMSGAVKLLNEQWRTGTALSHFLDGGLYGPLREDSLFRRPIIAVLASWSFIIWEIMFPFVLFNQNIAMAFVIIAFSFHLLVFRFFGLNRFVWAWMVTFPAVVYCAGQF